MSDIMAQRGPKRIAISHNQWIINNLVAIDGQIMNARVCHGFEGVYRLVNDAEVQGLPLFGELVTS